MRVLRVSGRVGESVTQNGIFVCLCQSLSEHEAHEEARTADNLHDSLTAGWETHTHAHMHTHTHEFCSVQPIAEQERQSDSHISTLQ